MPVEENIDCISKEKDPVYKEEKDLDKNLNIELKEIKIENESELGKKETPTQKLGGMELTPKKYKNKLSISHQVITIPDQRSELPGTVEDIDTLNEDSKLNKDSDIEISIIKGSIDFEDSIDTLNEDSSLEKTPVATPNNLNEHL